MYKCSAKASLVLDQIRSRSNSGVQVNLSTDVIKSTPILIPDKLVMEKFSKISNEFE